MFGVIFFLLFCLHPSILLPSKGDELKFTAKSWKHPSHPPGAPIMKYVNFKDVLVISCQTNIANATVTLFTSSSHSSKGVDILTRSKTADRIFQIGQKFNISSVHPGDSGYYVCH